MPEVLEAEEAILDSLRPEWEMTFAVGAAKALEHLERGPFDVLVTDFDMPVIDGAALVRKVESRWPRTVRVILSGSDEVEVARRVAHSAHQFVAKPCDCRELHECVERTFALHELLADPRLLAAFGSVGRLPVLPEIYNDALRLLENPARALSDVGKLIARDPVLSAKILQLVNSAFFGLSQPMTRIEHAVPYLGSDVIRSLVLMADVIREGTFDENGGASLYEVQRHAIETASLARRIVPDPRMGEVAFASGLLHDIGKVVLASRVPDRLRRAVIAALATRRPLHEVEADQDGATHAVIGAFLLAQWGLPYSIVEAVAHHHSPAKVVQRKFDVVGAVYVANLLSHEGESEGPRGSLVHSPLDLEYLERLGVAHRVPDWRAAVGAGQVGV
jgi:putative nucleotidyltransferase with HDIG domain